MAVAIQLRGKDQVIEAYENNDVPVWSIFQYKALITKGEGTEMLSKFLDLLATNAAGAIYTLKTYEDIDDPKKVKEKTEATGSLNFRLEAKDYEENGGGGIYETKKERYVMWNEIRELQKRIDEMNANPPEEKQTLEQAAIGLLSSPGELASLILAFKELFSGSKTSTPYPQLPQTEQPYRASAIAGVNIDDMPTKELTEIEQKKLEDALSVLIEKDKNLPNHLSKLAEIAEKNPGKFKILLLMLENY